MKRRGSKMTKMAQMKKVLKKGVFCKPFLHKVAKYKCRLLQNSFVGCCTYIL